MHILNSITIVNQLVIGANFTVTLVVGHSGVIDGRRLLLLQTQYCSLLLPMKPVLLREGRALQPLSDDLCLPCSPTFWSFEPDLLTAQEGSGANSTIDFS